MHLHLLVASPHRDDAAFSLGLAIDEWLGKGHTVSVLNCFTRSDYAPYSDVESLHPNDRVSFVSALRKREDEDWRKRAGGHVQFHDLDLLDAPLRLNCQVEEVLTAQVRAGDRAVARVEGALRKAVAKAGAQGLALLAPLAIGGHIDHRVVQQAACAVCAALPQLAAAFYEDLPYAAGCEAAALRDAAQQLPIAVEATFAVGTGEWTQAAAVRRKAELATCYDSQVDSAVIEAIATASARYHGRERLWCNAAWQASALALPA